VARAVRTGSAGMRKQDAHAPSASVRVHTHRLCFRTSVRESEPLRDKTCRHWDYPPEAKCRAHRDKEADLVPRDAGRKRANLAAEGTARLTALDKLAKPQRSKDSSAPNRPTEEIEQHHRKSASAVPSRVRYVWPSGRFSYCFPRGSVPHSSGNPTCQQKKRTMSGRERCR